MWINGDFFVFLPDNLTVGFSKLYGTQMYVARNLVIL